MAGTPPTTVVGRSETNNVFDAVIVGAGFAGLYTLYRLRGLGLATRVYEVGSGVGGTWFWNRYPGARCDVESLGASLKQKRSAGPRTYLGIMIAGSPTFS